MIKYILREYFLLPRGEQRALVLLSLLLILSLVARVGAGFIPEAEPPEAEQFFQEARKTLLAGEFGESKSEPEVPQDQSIPQGQPSLKGLPSLKGQPGVQIQPGRSVHSKTQAQQIQEINLNTADSLSLLPLPGIGPVLAGRIIKYRRLLGGFVNVEQLREVYGISPTTFGQVKSRVYIDSAAFHSLGLNTLEFKALLRHPYLGVDDVRRIVNFRDFSGNIISKEELSNHNLLPDSTLKKLLPYLDFRY